jgi:hypothetical protein
MDGQITSNKLHYFQIITLIALVVLAAAVTWLFFRVDSLADKQGQSTHQAQDLPTQMSGAELTVVKSGGGGFHMSFPGGWGPLVNVLDRDALYMGGTAQPVMAAGKKVEVIETQSYGTDSPSVFSAQLLDKGQAAPPQGTPTEFSIGKEPDMVVGKKYTYTYGEDTLAGIGHLRLEGDRDYEYVLPFNNKELHVYYSVYGSDPRNQVETVDEIVRTVIVATNLSPADL